MAVAVTATLVGAALRLWQLEAVPPGLHYDLAATALLGNEVAFAGARPLFITAFTGHEVLFYYWLAGWFNLIGSSVFSLRLAAALLGVLTIPATFFAVRQLLRHEGRWAGLLAALAAVFVAEAFFHVTFSRFGFRVIVQPLVQALALGWLARGLHLWEQGGARQAWLSLALGGVFTGLAAYTYLSARLLPVPLAVLWLAVLVAQPRRWGGAFGLFVAAAALTFAPLGAYFWQYPADFFNRASQVLPRPGDEALLLTSARRAVEMLVWDGEPYDRYNLPGLPLLPGVVGFLAVVGWAETVWRAGRARTALARATELFLLAWLPAMLLPTALSINDIFPSTIRALGVVPVLFVFPARGLRTLWVAVQRMAPNPLLPTAHPLTWVGLVALVWGSAVTYQTYFITWANLNSQRLNNDADLVSVAAYLNANPAREAVFVSTIHYRHPTLAYLARDFASLGWLTGGRALVVPADRDALIFSTRGAPLPAEWTRALAPANLPAPLSADGHPDFVAYRISAGAPPHLPEMASRADNFGNLITLTGYVTRPAANAIIVDARWQVLNPPPNLPDLLPFARLENALGERWTEDGIFTYPASEWQAGDTLYTRFILAMPPGSPPGVYTPTLGLYAAESQVTVARVTAEGGFGGQLAALSGVAWPGGPARPLAEFAAAHAFTPVNQPLAESLTVLGYTLAPTPVRSEEWANLRLFLAGEAPPALTALTLSWGEVAVPLSLTARSGAWVEVARLPVPAAPANLSLTATGKPVTLPGVAVQTVRRQLSPPALSTPANVDFGAVVRLAGYTLEPGPRTRLQLAWQAQARPPGDYTRFVHIRQGAALVAQHDAFPGGARTSAWLAGEYLTDDLTFDLPPGDYELWLGFYRLDTGATLPVAGAPHTLLTTFSIP